MSVEETKLDGLNFATGVAHSVVAEGEMLLGMHMVNLFYSRDPAMSCSPLVLSARTMERR